MDYDCHRTSLCPLIVCIIGITICELSLCGTLCYGDTTAAKAESVNNEPTESCGPSALAITLSLLGHSVESDAYAKLAETDEKGNTTLAGLKKAADALGISAVGMQLTPEELARINHPAILHVMLPGDDGHFVVFASSDGKLYELIDPNNGGTKDSVTAEQLKLLWEGRCLVFTPRPLLTSITVSLTRADGMITCFGGAIVGILLAVFGVGHSLRHYGHRISAMARRSLASILAALVSVALIASAIASSKLLSLRNGRSKPDGPRLVLASSVIDVGTVAWKQRITRKTWIGNSGRGTLSIDKKRLRASCSCVRTSLSGTELDEGEKGELRIGLTASRIGPFRYSILIPSNDPKEAMHAVLLKGKAVGPAAMVYPLRLYFEWKNGKEQASRSLTYAALRPGIKVLEATSDSDLVKCNIQSTPLGTYSIDVSVAKSPGPGAFENSVRIVTNNPEADIRVPLYGK